MCVYVCEFASFSFGLEGGMWALIVSVPDYCLPFHFYEEFLNGYRDTEQTRNATF